MDGYRKIEILGRGTYGTVYLCERKKHENKIVLKEIDKSLSQTVIQAANNEINILQSLRHPNIIQYYRHFICQSHFGIIMEYATKGNLFEYIAKQRHALQYISQDIVLNIFCQILLGLDYIHSKNIIHRDLKCENILITGLKYDIIKIADFGISKLLASNEQTSTVIGTPNYLAPEICDGLPYDFKSDIWSLGCILYEMCALERMFEGNIANVVLAIVCGNMKKINYNIYDTQIQDITDKCLIVEPSFRPNTTTLIQHPILLAEVHNILVNLGRILF